MSNETDTQPPSNSPSAGADGSVMVKMSFRVTEIHTIERRVDAAQLQHLHEYGDAEKWLEEQFIDDPFSDSDLSTESVELIDWKSLNPKLTGGSPVQ